MRGFTSVAVGLALALASHAAEAQEAATATPAVEPAAVQAVQRMRAYLGTLTAFQVDAETTLDVVMEDGQKVQLSGEVQYQVRRPDGLMISTLVNRATRRFYYDGRNFTVYAPKLGYYAQTAAPSTMRELFDAAAEKYGVALPLEDLFHWSEPGDEMTPFTTAFLVGQTTSGGVTTDHYAFRQGELDWEVWIETGPRPLPRKLVIVDRADDARPAYSARLSWNLQPNFAADAFVFTPDAEAKRIRLANTDQEQAR